MIAVENSFDFVAFLYKSAKANIKKYILLKLF